MKKVDKVFKVAIGILIVAVFGLTFFSRMYLLEEPIILKTYAEYKMQKEEGGTIGDLVHITYVTHSGDTRRIMNAQGRDEDGHEFYFHPAPYYSRSDGRGVYEIHHILLQAVSYGPNPEEDHVILKTLTFGFDDFSQQTVDIGQIIFFEDGQPEKSFVKSGTVNYTGEGDRTIVYEAKEEFTIDGVESSILDTYSESLELLINGESITNNTLTFKRGDQLDVSIRRIEGGVQDDRGALYMISPNLTVTDRYGNRHSLRLDAVGVDARTLDDQIFKSYIRSLKENYNAK